MNIIPFSVLFVCITKESDVLNVKICRGISISHSAKSNHEIRREFNIKCYIVTLVRELFVLIDEIVNKISFEVKLCCSC